MTDNTKIEWTDATWTPIRACNVETGKVGWHCEHTSPGCENCYAENMNRRLGTRLPFKPGHRKDIEVFLDPIMLMQPLLWKRPRNIFVCSMTDLFGSFVTDEMIHRIFAVMALCPHHTFQVLTKRSARMREYCTFGFGRLADIIMSMRTDGRPVGPLPHIKPGAAWWPLANVWLGVSAEDQRRYDERREDIEQTPAAKRFLSIEPMLGAIDIRRSLNVAAHLHQEIGVNLKPIGADKWGWIKAYNVHTRETLEPLIDWVIVGGESGRFARPMHPDWARTIRDQCEAAGVAFHFKQWGEFAPRQITRSEFANPKPNRVGEPIIGMMGQFDSRIPYLGKTVDVMRRVGKKAAGRVLDGREWDGMPASADKASAA